MEQMVDPRKFRAATKHQKRELSGLKPRSPAKRLPSRILRDHQHGRLISPSGAAE